jgi:RNA polymerase sigma-70 factor (ECF subfamily)
LILTPDRPSFEQVVEKHYADLFRFALSLARNEPDASDLVQQVYTVYAVKGAQIRDATKIKSWLFTSLYREFLRNRSRNQRFVSEAETPQDTFDAAAPSDAGRVAEYGDLMEALHSLDDGHRAVLTLFYMDQCSYKEIANIIGAPIGTVMSRLSRAKEALREKLKDIPGNTGRW